MFRYAALPGWCVHNLNGLDSGARQPRGGVMCLSIPVCQVGNSQTSKLKMFKLRTRRRVARWRRLPRGDDAVSTSFLSFFVCLFVCAFVFAYILLTYPPVVQIGLATVAVLSSFSAATNITFLPPPLPPLPPLRSSGHVHLHQKSAKYCPGFSWAPTSAVPRVLGATGHGGVWAVVARRGASGCWLTAVCRLLNLFM